MITSTGHYHSVDWTIGLTYFLNKPIHAIKTIIYTPHLVAMVCQEHSYDGSDSNNECTLYPQAKLPSTTFRYTIIPILHYTQLLHMQVTAQIH